MARDFGLKELYLWPINADQQGTPQQVRKVVDTVAKESAGNLQKARCRRTRRSRSHGKPASATAVLFVDSLRDEDGPVPTYLGLLKVDAETIVEALSE